MAKLHHPEQHQLSNGIPVILQHYDGPVATTYWWVKTGSADETTAEAGFAHFLEHMLFKDAAAKETGKASTGMLARAVESMGGDINAYTSFDQTVYHVTCAAQHWEKVIDAFGAMAKPQKFLKSDFVREREVILEELRKNEDSPSRQLFQSLFSGTFRKHPYGRPVIGFVKTLKAAQVGNLEAFYRRNYISGKMGLVLVGPINDQTGARRKAILQQLEKHLGTRLLPKKMETLHQRPVEPALRKDPHFSLKTFDVKTPSVAFSFRVPELNHEDIPALDLLAGILGMGELSRLYQDLFYKNSLVTEVSGGLYVPKDAGMLYFQAEMDSVDKIETVSRAIFKELRRLGSEGPTPEELARVIVSAESERLYATQTADGMAGRLGFLKFIMGDLEFDRRYLEDLKAVDAARIQEVARKYLIYSRMTGIVLLPKGDKTFNIDTIRDLAEEVLCPERLAAPAIARGHAKTPKNLRDQMALPVEVTQLPSGIKVCYFDRPQSHVFSVHASVFGGLRLEMANPVTSPEADWGSSYMMSLSWTKGTAHKSAREISAIVEGHASGMDGFAGRNSVGLQMTGLSRDWGVLSGLFNEVLVGATFPEDEVGHSRRIAEDSVRSVEDHSSQLCSKLFLETLFEHHPYGRLTIGSLESLATIQSTKLRSFHQKWLRPERLVLSVSGSVNRSALDHWLKDLDGQLRAYAQQTPAQGTFSIPPDEEALKAPRWIERNLEREQTHIIVGGLGTQITSDDRHALRLLQTLLGGQSGRLFVELREKKSLAYTVAPMSFEGIERGYVGTYIACAPQKKQEAMDGIRQVLETLASKGPTAREMARAKEFFLGRRAMDLQSDSALATHFGLETLYGILHVDEAELTRKIRTISAKDVQRICAKYFVEPYQVTSIVG
ncbi:pitrilysin family protein [Bdellovibrionota bacterium FG-1]